MTSHLDIVDPFAKFHLFAVGSICATVRVAAGPLASNERELHAFSWIGPRIVVSQRVANDTAQVLDEIEQRFPMPRCRRVPDASLSST